MTTATTATATRVRILHDDSAETPRTAYSNVGTVVSFNRDFAGDGPFNPGVRDSDFTIAEYMAERIEVDPGLLWVGVDYQDYGSSGARLYTREADATRADAVIYV